jgi:TPR repeat protein
LSPLPHELAEQLAQAQRACEQAVREQPNAARLHAGLARVRALAGDAGGALEAARRGAELGSPTAQVPLGVMYADGLVVTRDHAAARELFHKAAKAGEPRAYFNLGVMSANGWGLEAHDADAAASFRLAALGGDVVAMQVLGAFYETGRGFTPDKAQAEQ